MTTDDGTDEVGLLEWVRRTGDDTLARAVKAGLGLEGDDEPLDVPLHDLDWRRTVLTPEGGDADYVRVPHPCVGRDTTGRRFLARRGDLLLRDGHGHYVLIKVVHDA